MYGERWREKRKSSLLYADRVGLSLPLSLLLLYYLENVKFARSISSLLASIQHKAVHYILYWELSLVTGYAGVEGWGGGTRIMNV